MALATKIKEWFHHEPHAKKFSRSEAAILLFIALMYDETDNSICITYDRVHEHVALLPQGYHIAIRRLLTRRLIRKVDGDCYSLDI